MLWVVGVFAAVALGVGVALLVSGGSSDTASAKTVRFQRPQDPGPSPFTNAADVKGPDQVKLQQVGSGPYGGTGSDLVCDRELLIRSLRARPDRMAEWARVRGIDPAPDAVASYIRSLRPVTLTRDTRVTNYSFENGRAVGYQSILQAGTAVLVDRYGEPVARCRCGNPLTKPVYYRELKCQYCPPDYKPPPGCYYRPYGPDGSSTTGTSDTTTGSDSGSTSGKPYSNCYQLYPHPPGVKKAAKSLPYQTQYEAPPQTQTQPSYQPYTQTPDDHTNPNTTPYTQDGYDNNPQDGNSQAPRCDHPPCR